MPRYPSPAAPRVAPPDLDHRSLSSELTARLVVSWRALCEDERDSVIAATLVAGDLARLGAPPSILSVATRVIEDEVRHVSVCATVLQRLGASAAEVPAEERRCGIGDDPSIERRTALALVAGFGVGESISAGWLAAARRACRQPMLHWALTELLRDEARHGAFGIDAGRWLTRNWSDDERRTLWPGCVAEMEDFERRLGGPVAANETPATDLEASSVGILSAHESCAAVVRAVERWVIPSLARLGVLPLPLPVDYAASVTRAGMTTMVAPAQ
ncbi:MAG TPA: ferritin-like domain-containing protein [Polyangia bacterium]